MINKRWLGEIATNDGQEPFDLRPDRLLRQLLLFDEVVVYSSRLREFEGLVRAFGSDGVIALLRSGAVRVHCHAQTIGQIGQTDLDSRKTKGALPPLSYAFASVSSGATGSMRREYVHSAMQNVRGINGLSFRDEKLLVREIASRLVDPIDLVGAASVDQLISDLRANADHIGSAVTLELMRKYGPTFPADRVRVRLHQLNDSDFRAETNLTDLSIQTVDAHKVIETALLAVGGLNQRVAEMQHYEALVNLWYRDLPVLGAKLRALTSAHAPEALDATLVRVLAIPGFPDLSDAIADGALNLHRFLEVRSSDDARQFRAWIRQASDSDIGELRQRTMSLRGRLALKLGSIGGKTLRLALTTGAGLGPYGFLTGATAGLVDTFLIEALLGNTPQPLAFLSRHYTSVFERH